MNLEDVNNVKEIVEYIKWSIQTPGSLWDVWIATDDEIRSIAEGIF